MRKHTTRRHRDGTLISNSINLWLSNNSKMMTHHHLFLRWPTFRIREKRPIINRFIHTINRMISLNNVSLHRQVHPHSINQHAWRTHRSTYSMAKRSRNIAMKEWRTLWFVATEILIHRFTKTRSEPLLQRHSKVVLSLPTKTAPWITQMIPPKSITLKNREERRRARLH